MRSRHSAGGTGLWQKGHNVSVPSLKERGLQPYNRDVPFQSVMFDVTSILRLWVPYGKCHNR